MSKLARLASAPLAAILTAGALAVSADAAPQVPRPFSFSAEAEAFARREMDDAARAPIDRAECHRPEADVLHDERAAMLRTSDDNDATHYARGLTLIINLFIDHAGGSWSLDETDIAAARNAVAKEYFTAGAPAEANMHFDYEGQTFAWGYIASVPDLLDDESDFTVNTINDAIADLGFVDSDGDGSRIDDITYWLKAWNGGWDNVILVAQPADLTGRASASYGFAYTRIFTDDSANVRAHEWGHIFGSCDEYVENNMCNGGIDCGACQSWYLDTTVANGNCQLTSCPSDVPCLMDNNTFTGICPYTERHWGWVDTNTDGMLDRVKRPVNGGLSVWIDELQTTDWILSSSVTNGYVYHQTTSSWAVVGLRSPANANYDLTLFAENDHRVSLTTSGYTGTTVDFVVGDYNHSAISNEHVAVSRASGNTETYRIQYESGTAVLYADGLVRNGSWDGTDVVRVWDVPLFAGENVSFVVDPTSGSANFGMALFRSGGAYWAGRAGAEVIADAAGNGGVEFFNYQVPADDVYGLVLFASNASASQFTIQIGPNLATLAEETPITSGSDLRLFNYDPNAASWAVVGNRAGTNGNTTLRLFDDTNYTQHLETSSHFNGGAPSNVEFVAVDYNHASGALDHVRIVDENGLGIHATEWEHDDDLIAGILPTMTWDAGHVCKVWDAFLEDGASYLFRSYGTAVDQGIYFFSSADGDYYKSRLWASSGANIRPASTGEWVSFTATQDDWYGLAMIVNDGSSGSYQNILGRKTILADDLLRSHPDQVQFGTTAVTQAYWHVWGVRPESPTASTVARLYGDDGYTISTMKASDSGTGVNFVVADYNHTPLETVYPFAYRSSGTGGLRFEMEGANEGLVFSGGPPVSWAATWPAGDVVEILDVYLSGSMPTRIQLNDASGGMDLGLALFKSSGAAYYAPSSNAVAQADAAGPGGSEVIQYTTPAGGDWYGLVVYNKGEAGGDFEVIVGAPTATDVATLAGPVELSLAASPNPFRDASDLVFALPREERVTLAVYDAAGRLVRRLAEGFADAGVHERRWDGRDGSGQRVGAGVYFARLETAAGARMQKLIRLR